MFANLFLYYCSLSLRCNALSTICSEAVAFFARLETLLLNDNAIREWNQVWKLSSLPKLETLVLSGNPLESIGYNVELQSGLPGEALSSMRRLNEWLIVEWFLSQSIVGLWIQIRVTVLKAVLISLVSRFWTFTSAELHFWKKLCSSFVTNKSMKIAKSPPSTMLEIHFLFIRDTFIRDSAWIFVKN